MAFACRMRMQRTLFALLAAAAACGGTGSTDATTLPSTPVVITTEVKDSTSLPAGSTVVVRAHVTVNGSPVTGVAVTWALVGGHGQISATTGGTDSTGVATVSWTLSDTAGVNSLAIGSAGVGDTLHVIGTIGQASQIVLVSPYSSSVAAGSAVTLQARVLDRPGNPVSKTNVNWSATGGTLTSASSASDATGTVQNTFRASQPGTYLVTADVPGQASVVFQVIVQ
jgi:hypothetical protein